MGLVESIRGFFRGAPAEPREQAGAPAPRRLIVGLGNPGPKYANTRHNIGFRIVERLAERLGGSWRVDAALEAEIASVELAGESCLLMAPQTFMNNSGRSVEVALTRWPELAAASDVFILYDDMDLPTGRIRLRPSGGAGGHRGIGDILAVLETKAVPRLRFGVGHPGQSGAVLDWVLAPFPAEDSAVLAAAVDRAADAVEIAIREGLPSAMGQFNSAD